MQMQEENCSNILESATGQKKRRKRGKLLYSSRRVLARSRMRVSKHMSRLTADETHGGVRIDFCGEEVNNLASLQEEDAAMDATQSLNEENDTVVEGTTTRPTVRDYPSIQVSKIIACRYDLL